MRGKVFMQMALVEIPPGVDDQGRDEVEVPVRKTLASASYYPGFISNRTGPIPTQILSGYAICRNLRGIIKTTGY